MPLVCVACASTCLELDANSGCYVCPQIQKKRRKGNDSGRWTTAVVARRSAE